MNWLNIETKVLHSPEYIGSDPASRATWLNLSLWSATLENGGRIVGARLWKDRQWQQTCGVTRREVDRSDKLLSWSGDDLLVWNYPCDTESCVRSKREIARTNGLLGGRPIKEKPMSVPTLVTIPKPTSESVREGKEKEEERKERKGVQGETPAPPAPPAAPPAVETKPDRKPKLTDDQWLSGLRTDVAYFGINIDHEHAKCARWCTEKRKLLTRSRFINWLNRCDRPMNTSAGKSQFSGSF